MRVHAAILCSAMAALAAAAAGVARPDPFDSKEAREARDVLCGYAAARGDHDFARASALSAPGIRWLDGEGHNHPKNDARLKSMLAWEAVMRARWSCRTLGFSDGWFEAEISEQNRMYDALGVGAVVQRDRVRVAGGQIQEGRTLAEWTTGRDEDEAFAEFKAWLKTLPPGRRKGVLRDGNLVFDAAAARATLPLLDLWERAHPPARRLLAAALDALGGERRIAALDGWIVEGRGRENLSAELQGLSPNEPTWRPHEEKVAVVRASASVAWERRTPRNDRSLRWRRFIDTADATGVVDWTSGYGAMRPGAVPLPAREALMRRIPHLLLLDAVNGAKRLVAKGERRFESAPHDVVEATLPDDTRLSLLLSRNPRSLARVEYAVYLPGLGDSVVAWTWRGWKKSRPLGLAPSGHTVHVNGTVFQEVDYTRYEAGSADAAAMMEVPPGLTPAGARREPVAAAGPATGEVAPGVHVAQIQGFFTAFVEFADFVVVFDAPASPVSLEAIPAAGRAECDLAAEELRAVIARTCPGKPVRFVVVSHHHSDHLGGIRAFGIPGITILAAPGEVSAVRRALTATHTLAPDLWSGDGREIRIEAVPDRRVIGDGRRRLEVIRIGENPHTNENLFAWLPDERLLLNGDLFYYEEGSPFPPSGRALMNRFCARWLAGNGIAPAAVYGVHYPGAAGPQALAQAASAGEDPIGHYLASIDLLNRHDVEGQLATYAPGAVVVEPDGARHPIDLRLQRRYRELEAKTHARFDYAIVQSTPDSIEVLETEQSDRIEALGVSKPHWSRWRYKYCGGRVCELQRLGRDEEEPRRFRFFRDWHMLLEIRRHGR